MPTNVRAATGTEAANDALNAIVSKALGFPTIGAHVGGGLHVNMSHTWDGQGATPPGWTKQRQQVWAASALSTALPLPDDLIPSLQSGPAQGRLTGPEIAALATAIAGRVTVDLEAGYSPKASTVSAGKASAARDDP